MKRKGLSWDEHKELGNELRQIDARLFDLHHQFDERYGKTSIATRSAKNAHKALRELRQTLDRSDILRSDLPDRSDDELNHLYMGPDKFED